MLNLALIQNASRVLITSTTPALSGSLLFSRDPNRPQSCKKQLFSSISYPNFYMRCEATCQWKPWYLEGKPTSNPTISEGSTKLPMRTCNVAGGVWEFHGPLHISFVKQIASAGQNRSWCNPVLSCLPNKHLYLWRGKVPPYLTKTCSRVVCEFLPFVVSWSYRESVVPISGPKQNIIHPFHDYMNPWEPLLQLMEELKKRFLLKIRGHSSLTEPCVISAIRDSFWRDSR